MGQCLRKPKRQVEPGPLQRDVPERGPGGQGEAGGLQRPIIPQFPTSRPMALPIRHEYLRALYRGFGNLSYAIIGGAALVEYDLVDETSDFDVIVSSETKEEKINHLLQSNVNIVRTTSGRLG